jgi:hypothetical protein
MVRAHSRASALSVTPGNRAQLDRGRELAALLKRSADRCGLSLGDGEHRRSVGSRPGGSKRERASELTGELARYVYKSQPR